MTEGVFPSMLHQDPRYFRRGTGGKWSRLGYAVGQIPVGRSSITQKYSEMQQQSPSRTATTQIIGPPTMQ